MADNPQIPPAPGTSGEFKRKTSPTPPVAIPPLPAGVQKPALSPDAVREMKKETLRISLPPKPLVGGAAAPGAPRPPMMAANKQSLQPTKVIPAPAQLNVTRPLGVPAVMTKAPQLGGAAVPPPAKPPGIPAPLHATAPVQVPPSPVKPPTGVLAPSNLGKPPGPTDTQATQPLAKVTMPAARPMTTSPIPTASSAIKPPGAPVTLTAQLPAPAPGIVKPPGAPIAPPAPAVGGLPKPPGAPIAPPAPAVGGLPKPPGAPIVPPAPAVGGLPKPPGALGMPAPSAAPLPKAPAPILAGAAVPVAGTSADASKTAIIKGAPGPGHKPVTAHAPSGGPLPVKAPGAPIGGPSAPGAKLPVPAAAPKAVGAAAGPIKPAAPVAVAKPSVSQVPVNVVGDSVSTYLAVAACIVALLSVAITAASYFEVL